MRLDRFRLLTPEEKDRICQEIVDNCELQGDCWVWKGPQDSSGYGIKYIQGKMRTVSRFMLAYHTRESMNIKLDACHTFEDCLPRCCNPEHLHWDTHSENCKEREAWKRKVYSVHPELKPKKKQSLPTSAATSGKTGA